MNRADKPRTMDLHQRYEELCALAATGHLTGTERAELNQHLKACVSCGESLRAFAFLCVQVLPNISTGQALPAGMTERFIAAARSAGIAFSDRTKEEVNARAKVSGRNPWKVAFWASVAASVVLLGILTVMLARGHQSSASQAKSEQSQPTDRFANQQTKTREENVPNGAPVGGEVELNKLREMVVQKDQQLDELRRLNAAVGSSRELLRNRNLLVLDVSSRDKNGNSTRAFGRLFYVEGKRLEFYAFDLRDPMAPSEHDGFFVWGETKDTFEGNLSHVILLGKFTFDSSKDNRWTLVVTDPRVLAKLSSVFVTAESSERPLIGPTGKKLLLAFLDKKPDRP